MTNSIAKVMITAQDVITVAPLIVVFIGALIVLLLEVVTKLNWPRATVSSLVLLLALFYSLGTAELSEYNVTVFSGLLYADPYQSLFSILMIFGTLLVVILGASRIKQQGIEAPGEYYSLMLMALAGAIILVSAAEFITFFVALEILSMALYALCASALGQRRSAESGLKYFLLGCFASAILLYGVVLLFGVTGSFDYVTIANALRGNTDPLAYTGVALVLFGLCFKIGLVPFHFWAPDVYQGAPTSVTAFMAVVVKIAAVAAALRIIWTAFGSAYEIWNGLVWLVAVLTMFLGNLAALRQRSLKRMLAYSSIAHAGYISIGLLLPEQAFNAGASIVYYLIAYMFMTIGAFAILLACQQNEEQSDDLTELNGFASNNPTLAAAMAIFMLAMAGLPPAMSGFMAKFYVIGAAIKGGYIGLAILAVISAAIGCYYYLRVIVAMYFINGDSIAKQPINAPSVLRLLVVVCAAIVVLLGLFPGLIYDMAGLITSN